MKSDSAFMECVFSFGKNSTAYAREKFVLVTTVSLLLVSVIFASAHGCQDNCYVVAV